MSAAFGGWVESCAGVEMFVLAYFFVMRQIAALGLMSWWVLVTAFVVFFLIRFKWVDFRKKLFWENGIAPKLAEYQSAFGGTTAGSRFLGNFATAGGKSSVKAPMSLRADMMTGNYDAVPGDLVSFAAFSALKWVGMSLWKEVKNSGKTARQIQLEDEIIELVQRGKAVADMANGSILPVILLTGYFSLFVAP